MLMARTLRMKCQGGNRRPIQWGRGVERERATDSPARPGEYVGCPGSFGGSRSGSAHSVERC